eukprot:CAMPEP_0194576226 /NCGR_PEP_ID=MMETSP0292-20121207/11416_1 /TAXON_ID=39354 /ORGANISM="Heterosigma akashiwo, Strain CCMP2393" /LENGTH=341 /DNA_ID=CAMNT_0039428213 /DNA_START=389 /DNA_END=1414 /DNA_ORIENTATION=+
MSSSSEEQFSPHRQDTSIMLEMLAETPLLTAEEEIELGAKVKQLTHYEETQIQLEKQLGRPPTTEEWASSVGVESAEFQNKIDDLKKAKKLMVSSNMRLVISIAKRYNNLGVNFSDLIQEGSLGLIRATEKYDPSRGFKFSTYAAWWVQQSIMKSLANHSRTIRLPVHVHNLLYSVRREQRRAQTRGEQPLSESELAQKLDMPNARLQRYVRASRQTISTDKQVGPTSASAADKVQLGETIVTKVGADAEEIAELLQLRRTLLEVLDDLPAEQRVIMGLKYGIDGGAPKSIAQIAETINCSPDFARRCESRALRRLRHPANQHKMRQFLEYLKAEQQSVVL